MQRLLRTNATKVHRRFLCSGLPTLKSNHEFPNVILRYGFSMQPCEVATRAGLGAAVGMVWHGYEEKSEIALVVPTTVIGAMLPVVVVVGTGGAVCYRLGEVLAVVRGKK